MKVTTQLVKHLCDTLGLDKKHLDASTRVDAEVSAFVTDKMVSGELGIDKVKELTADVEVKSASSAVDQLVRDAVTKALGGVNLGGGESKKDGKPGSADVAKGASVDGTKDAGDARVKSAVEMYSHNRSTVTYSKSTNPAARKAFGEATAVVDPNGNVLNIPSQRDKAIAGAWFKHLINKSAASNGKQLPAGMRMTEHEKSLVRWAVENCEFVGPIGNNDDDNADCEHEFHCEKAVSDLHKKALLDDATSGGLEAVPIEFDAAVIMAPLLYGELFPLIDFQQVSRRRMEGYQIGEFTFSNTPEGTSITTFTTTSFISAFDTTINPITGACDVGLDFLEDSPANIGAQLNTRWSQGFMKEMDRQIAVGTGTGEMTGLTVTAGITSVSAVASSLPYKVDEAEGLLFAVPVQYRRISGQRAVFLSNDVVYRRFRSIPVGTSDARRVYGMNYEDYMLAGHPHKIHASLGNAHAGFHCLDRFRGYRRSGYSVNVVGMTDRDNALKNQQTIVVRARYGGQMTLAAASAVCTNLPTS